MARSRGNEQNDNHGEVKRTHNETPPVAELSLHIQELSAKLEAQQNASEKLTLRLIQQETQLRDLSRQVREITHSRIWRTFVFVGGWLLKQQRILNRLTLRLHWRSSAAEVIYITCDLPNPSHPTALFGMTLVQGWAAALTGIQRVEAGIAGGPAAEARTCLSRPDIRRMFSECAESGNAGFRAQLDLSGVPDGQQTLYIRAQSRRGSWLQSEYKITVDNSRTPRLRTAEESKKLIASMKDRPVISFIVPVFNTPEKWLRRCLDSVLQQHYPHWELCVANDASTDPHVRSLLEEYRAKDKRVKLIHCENHGHIARTSNAALRLAEGEYIALLDHDDEITPDALVEIALAVNANRTADMIYSDEDKIDEHNIRSDPFYKPDWSPEFFQTCMYTCHLGVYRTTLVRELGGFRPEVTGAQDYDLALRVVTRTNKICHVPKVLYHWRTLPTSTASGGDAKNYAYPAAQSAMRNYLKIRDVAGEVVPGPREGYHRIRFKICGEPKISIVILSAGNTIFYENRRIDLLRSCIESITSKSTWRNLEILVVDNDALRDDLKEFLKARNVRRVIDPVSNFNFSRRVNLGAEYASGDHLILLNDDTEVISPDWIESLLEYSQQPEIGAVGAKLLFPNGRIQHAGVVILTGNPGHPYYNHPADDVGYYLSAQVPRNYLAVTGACLMTRKSVFQDVGGLDTSFPLNYNDIDYCLRLHQKGLRIVYTPYAELYHYESVSKEEERGSVKAGELELFHERWLNKYYTDPYYNPNLPTDYPYYRNDS